MSTAVRVDTVRNQLAALQTMIGDIRLELDDLHALAWARSRTGDDPKVQGGTRDYALDTHGNPTARHALNTLKAALTTAAQDLAVALDEASYVLRQGDDGHGVVKSKALIAHADLATALAAQARRIERGETTSHRRLPQPGRDRALKAATKQIEKLQAENTKLRRRADRAEQRLLAVDHRIPEDAHDDWINRPPDTTP